MNDSDEQARRFAHAMKASLIFCSTSHSINVQKVHSHHD
jgi:GTP-binding protein of the ras superfamily involved in termination of M-phase